MRSRRSIWFVLLALLLIVVVAGVWWWMGYRESPRYALGRVASAAADGDWGTFSRYVDVSAVSSDIASQIIERRLGELGDQGILGALANAAQPVLADEVESQLRTAVESRSGAASTRERVGAFFYTNDPREITVRADRAFVTVDVPYQGKTRTLELEMQRQDEMWRVIRVVNIDELMQQAE